MKRPPAALSQSDALKMLEVCSNDRDRAMLILLWRAGLRNAEACDVRSEHLEDRPNKALRLHVPHGKGERARFVALDPKSAEIIRPLATGGLLLRTRTGKKLHTSHVRRAVRALARRAGIQRRVHPHALRHTFARDLYEEKFGVREIQLLLGHSSLNTTQVYLESLGCSDAAEAAESRSW